jgi:hypothetical protein
MKNNIINILFLFFIKIMFFGFLYQKTKKIFKIKINSNIFLIKILFLILFKINLIKSQQCGISSLEFPPEGAQSVINY